MSSSGSIPSYDAHLFTDDALAEPYGHYQALRDLGFVVWLEAHDVHAVARYEDVRAFLRNVGRARTCQEGGVPHAVAHQS